MVCSLFFNLFFSYCILDWIISIGLFSSELPISSTCSNLLLSPSSGYFFLHFLHCNFNSRIPVWLFCIIYMFLLIFNEALRSYFLLVLYTLFLLTKHIYSSWFKYFSSKLNVLTTSGTISIIYFYPPVYGPYSSVSLYILHYILLLKTGYFR